jgi:hypothetical protein
MLNGERLGGQAVANWLPGWSSGADVLWCRLCTCAVQWRVVAGGRLGGGNFKICHVLLPARLSRKEVVEYMTDY